jgi:aspartyl-tRNA(Asn)/glutamyl-tRNA(Gln) amidotransferase subunit C
MPAMPEKLTDQQVRHVAKLSRLKLDAAQVRYFAEQLSDVLGYIDKLGELDVADIEPMAHPTNMTNRLRADDPVPGMPVDQALANAPDADPPFFKVPKVLGDAGSA